MMKFPKIDTGEGASREEVTAAAVSVGNSLCIPDGYRVVVVATDYFGRFVGVWRNVEDEDTVSILRCAQYGAERHDSIDGQMRPLSAEEIAAKKYGPFAKYLTAIRAVNQHGGHFVLTANECAALLRELGE